MVRARQVWLAVHRWVGLTVGPFFVLLGLTGSLLVFDHAVDEWLNPEILLSTGAGEHRPLAEILGSARAAHPDLGTPVLLQPPRHSNGTYTLRFQEPDPPREARRVEVQVDPATARVRGRRTWGRYPMSWIYKLHFTLHGGESGRTVVGVAGLLLMLSAVSGVCLWWPLLLSGWRAAWAVRGGKIDFDVHKSVGAVGGVVLVTSAFTGVSMTFPWLVEPLARSFSEETKAPTGLASTPPPAGTALGPDAAVAVARGVFPEAQFASLRLPQGTEGVYVVGLRRPSEVRRTGSASRVWIDQYSGDVLAVRNWDDFTAADTFLTWQFPLHNGEAFGLVGRGIVFVAGFVPTVLYVTGVRMWLRKRRGRRRRQAFGSTAQERP